MKELALELPLDESVGPRLLRVDDLCQRLKGGLLGHRFSYHDEKGLQRQIEEILVRGRYVFRREYRLGRATMRKRTLEDEGATRPGWKRTLEDEGATRCRPREVADFWFADYGLVLEVKVKGSALKHLRQCERYAAHAEVKGVMLCLPRNHELLRAMDGTIGGKPFYYVALWRNLL